VRMTAAVSREGERHPRLEAVDLEEPRAGEVLVRIVASGICHTDLRAHAGGAVPTPRPVVLGHEGAGIVERVGASVTSLRPGDPVVLSGSSCGVCPSCKRNLPSYCHQGMPRSFGGSRMDGTTPISQNGVSIHASFFGQSSFAEYALAEERTAVKVPNDVPLEQLGPLGCGVITGAGAVFNALQVGVGTSIAVFGTGGVGLSAVMAARLAGAARIIAIDTNRARLEVARDLGATDTIDATKGDIVPSIRNVLPHGVDYSFNTTTAPEIFTHAIDCLAKRGAAAFVSVPRGEWTPQMFGLLANGRRLQGVVGGDAAPQLFIPMLIDYWRRGRFPFDRLIKTYSFDAIGTAFHDCETGVTVKPVLRMAS
jgi:aryl-alcohol dehydrogenase